MEIRNKSHHALIYTQDVVIKTFSSILSCHVWEKKAKTIRLHIVQETIRPHPTILSFDCC